MSNKTYLVTGTLGRGVKKQLTVLYEKTLRSLAKLPDESVYRQKTAALTRERLEMVQQTPDVEKLQAKINSGLIEEVIKQADQEAKLATKMLRWRAWEPLIEQAPPQQWRWPI